MRFRQLPPCLVLVLLALLPGCITAAEALAINQRTVSGLIGCPPEQIVISDLLRTFTINRWKATCGDRVFYCSTVATMGAGTVVTPQGVGQGTVVHDQVSCAPAAQR